MVMVKSNGYGHDWKSLVAMTNFVITNRTNVPELTAEEAADLGFTEAQVIHVESPPISATAIRQAVASGGGIDGLVPPVVGAIIRERGLYV